MQFVCPGESGRAFISFSILFGSAHEAFAINCVVVIPVSDGCYCNSGLEYGRSLTHTHDGHVSAITPAPDADTVFVYIRLATHILGCCHLIFRLFHTKIQISAFFEVCTTSAGSTSVYTDYDKTTTGHIGFPTDAPCVQYLL